MQLLKNIQGSKLEHPVTSRLNKNDVICIPSIHTASIFNILKIIHSVASSVSPKTIRSPPTVAFHAPAVIRKVCLLRKLQRVLPLTSPMRSKAPCIQPSSHLTGIAARLILFKIFLQRENGNNHIQEVIIITIIIRLQTTEARGDYYRLIYEIKQIVSINWQCVAQVNCVLVMKMEKGRM